MSGSVGPDDFGPNWIYENIQEVTVNCRKLLLIYLLILSYALLSTVTTPVKNLFLGQNVTMPVLNFSIPLNQYLLLTPLIVIGFFIYIQIYLRKVNKMASFAIDTCKAKHDECCLEDREMAKCSFNQICTQLQNRFYPWMFIYSRYSHEKIIRSLHRFFFICSLWFFLPITLFAVSLFIIKTHSAWNFYFLLVMMLIGNAIVFFFWRFQMHLDFSFKTNFFKRRYLGFLALLMTLTAILTSLYIQGQNGRLWGINENVWSEDAGLYTRFIRSLIFADLGDKQLATEASNSQVFHLMMKNVHFEGANLSNVYAAKINLAKAHLQYANLQEANLNDSVLTSANLTSSTLAGAHLRKTKLNRAIMNGCDLSEAKLMEANLDYARLRHAYLNYTDLKDATFINADVYFADFRGAINIDLNHIRTDTRNWQFAFFDEKDLPQLGLPKNHNRNLENNMLYGHPLNDIEIDNLSGFDLSMSTLSEARLGHVNLQNAILQYADLSKADLTAADFRGADLTAVNLLDTMVQWADFRRTKGLTSREIKKAKFYPLAYYDDEIINQLGLSPNHNQRLQNKNLSNYNFSKFKSISSYGNNLKADFSEADFLGMNLKSANFKQVDLRGADFEEAYLKQANFSGALLIGANFNKADLDGAKLDGANVRGADFRSSINLSIKQIKAAHSHQLAKYDTQMLRKLGLPERHNELLENKNLSGYNLNDAHLKEAVLNEFVFTKATFVNADLTDANFDSANLRGADLSNATLEGALLTETVLENAKFNAANLRNTILSGADLQYADMRAATGLTSEQLKKANNYYLAKYSKDLLEKMGLPSDHNKRLDEKKLQRYSLNGASLYQARLIGFVLTEADLRDADLRWANLSGANLCGANLQNADFRYANLRNLATCDEADAVAQFSTVKSLFQATLDPSLKSILEADYPSLFKNYDTPEYPSDRRTPLKFVLRIAVPPVDTACLFSCPY